MPKKLNRSQHVLDVLVDLLRFRYLRSTQLVQLLPHRSEDGLRRTLKRMREADLIALPSGQWRWYNGLNCPWIYEITQKGIDLVGDERPARVTNLIRRRSDTPIAHFPHNMMIVDTLVSLKAGVEASGCQFIPFDEIMNRVDTPYAWRLPCTLRGQDFRVMPDALFGIRYPNNKVWFHILEAERTSAVWPDDWLDRTCFRKKVYAYDAILRNGSYRDRLKIPNLRLLFVFNKPSAVNKAMTEFTAVFEGAKIDGRLFATDIPTPDQVKPDVITKRIMLAPEPMPELFTKEWIVGAKLKHRDYKRRKKQQYSWELGAISGTTYRRTVVHGEMPK